MMKRYAVMLLAAVAAISCAKEKPKARDEKVPVTVAVAEQRDVPVQLRTIGSVQPYSTVAVRAQVPGQLMQVHFREGDDVRRGALLFTIDPRPYEADLAKARAALARDEAELRNAEAERTRYAELVKKDYVTREEYGKIVASAESARAVAVSDRAEIQNAELALAYCSIHAPIDGRTGSLQVHAGNIIRANDTTPLVVINQVQPVYVQFSVPERELAKLRATFGTAPVPVSASSQGNNTALAQGKLSFVDNAIDPTTGTITLKGLFDNANRALWPGQFVNVSVTLSSRTAATVVPTQAVQNGQRGQYVYVVKNDGAVEMRQVSVAMAIDQSSIIDKGVTPGETVVTDGQIRLTPKSHVEVKKNL
ncbi:MAG: efflux pump, family, rane fusion lipoprotein [Acidobacteria bacterium]|nr:efflux pump, family, rane fusion lipoprotein [Acidobacteriota bacterium]